MNLKKGVKGFQFVPIEDRFWSKVNKTDNCWVWIGSLGGSPPKNYGQFWMNGKIRKATHVSWELHHKKAFPLGLMACHSCDNPPCVNPQNIFVGTMKENIIDASKKGRLHPQMGSRKSCKNGHDLTVKANKKDNGYCGACAKDIKTRWINKNIEHVRLAQRIRRMKRKALTIDDKQGEKEK